MIINFELKSCRLYSHIGKCLRCGYEKQLKSSQVTPFYGITICITIFELYMYTSCTHVTQNKQYHAIPYSQNTPVQRFSAPNFQFLQKYFIISTEKGQNVQFISNKGVHGDLLLWHSSSKETKCFLPVLS